MTSGFSGLRYARDTKIHSNAVLRARDFLPKGLRQNQIGQLTTRAGTFSILVCSVSWGDDNTRPIPLTVAPNQPPNLNPWRYVSSSPTNNTSSYDLWVDLFIGGQTYRVSNWSKQPQVF